MKVNCQMFLRFTLCISLTSYCVKVFLTFNPEDSGNPSNIISIN